MTGSTRGLGEAVASRLEARGEEVVHHGRAAADLSSLSEVRRFAGEVGEVDLLVNNAGLISFDRQESADGYELCFAVNYLAGFLLWHELTPPRVINIASIGQQEIDFGDVMLEQAYDPARAYSQSKLAQILFTFELAERAPGGVTSDALHPATFMDTDMGRQIRGPGSTQSTVAEGADAVMHVIDTPGTGRYFEGRWEATADPQAYDPDARKKLWHLTEELCGTA